MTAIKVPPLGESIVEATISRWLKHEGDTVSPGDSLVELETDKITVEVPAMSRGVLTKVLHKEGEIVKVDDLLCDIDESAAGAAPQDSGAGVQQPASAAPQPAAAASGEGTGGRPPAQPQSQGGTPAASASPSETGTVRASPSAQKIAAEQRIDLAGVQGTGRGGVVSKPDVLDHQAAQGAAQEGASPAAAAARPPVPVRPAAAPAASAPTTSGQRETREVMSTRRKRIAEHLLEAQHATAHLTTFNEIDMSAVSALRQRLKDRVEKEYGVKLSFMPFFAKAACMALKTYPTVNAQIDGDSIVFKHYVNMGIAVAVDGGLVVPCIKDADQKGILDIARAITALAAKARDGKLVMDDLTGGSFTITNGGVFGSLVSTPILNYPQVGILGLHKIQDRPVAIEGRVEIRPMMYVALSYDHRVIDGQNAVLFLVRVKALMEDPASMLVE